ncbi:fungal specific transcription factor domain-containing protein [Aspergillus undulatus]|uniref:fungal specific transcription factor domain-containing protein n=1 Tax=Aspergillus undulatus TaxID=1810928 RepID=UPI003CCDCB65
MNINQPQLLQQRRKKRSRSGCNTCRARKIVLATGVRQSDLQKRREERGGHTDRASTVDREGSNAPYEDNVEPAWLQRLESTPAERTSPAAQEEPEEEPSSLIWLTSSDLPDKAKVRVIVDNYFAHVHPIRCFAFLHRPSFLQRADEELEATPSALLYVVCALGAQFYALGCNATSQKLSPKFILRAGCRWGETAYSMVLRDLDKISVDNLMASQLLYDYALRVGNFAQAFMLGGLTARMAQALQINLEYSTDVLCLEPGLSTSAREARRRLMWSCFVTDALLGSGVDQLMLVEERDIKIQLPCNERRFLQEAPCITRTIDGSVLGFLRPESIPVNPDENMGIMAYFIQHIRIRKQVLRYIKHLDTAISPWLPNSEFAILDKACWDWYNSLPENLRFNTSTIYSRKASSQLGALVLLHCSHYQTLCDLYRLGAPALFKLRSAIEFPADQTEFLQKLRLDLYDAAKALARIIDEAERHGPHILSDTWLPTITYDSSRIMLYYLTQLIDPREQDSKDLVVQTIPYLQSNIRALRAMQPLNAVSERLCNLAETMLRLLGSEAEIANPGRNIVPDDPYPPDTEELGRQSPPGIPAQSAPDYVLNPLTIYRMARRTIPERHAPERIASATGGATQLDISPPTLTGADELMLFTSDLGWAWQPAETAIDSGLEHMGLHPWVGGIIDRQAEPGFAGQLPFSS